MFAYIVLEVFYAGLERYSAPAPLTFDVYSTPPGHSDATDWATEQMRVINKNEKTQMMVIHEVLLGEGRRGCSPRSVYPLGAQGDGAKQASASLVCGCACFR